jgi:hypothetical protein
MALFVWARWALNRPKRRVSARAVRILTAEGPLAVDQDELGVQGTVCAQSGDKSTQVWRKPMSDGSIVVVALNRNAAGGR